MTNEELNALNRKGTFFYEMQMIKSPTTFDLKSIATPKDAYKAFMDYRGMPNKMSIYVLHLNAKQLCHGYHIASEGTINSTSADPREIFAPAIVNSTASIIVMYNHPSNSLSYSETEVATARKLVEAGRLLTVPLADFIIFTLDGYVSFKETNLI